VIALLFLAGLFVGSFLNVLIYRIPRAQQFIAGRSRCPHCQATLAWYDLIPVVSFLLLRGHCRYCHARISLRYPAVELASGLIFVFAPSYLAIAVLEILLVIAIIDYEHLIIPDSFVIILALLGLWNPHVFTALGSAGFFFILWAISKGRWIGFGDVKLAGALGLFFGFPSGPLVIYLAIISGGILGAFLLLLGKAHRKTALPFGTLLAIAAGTMMFFQEPILRVFHSYFSL